MRRKFFSHALTALFGALAFRGAAEACSVCINGAGGERLTDAFNWSVIFLMAMPYAILFSVVGFFVYAYRRAAKKALAAAESAPALELAWIHKESGR